jgi:hypothetical protein
LVQPRGRGGILIEGSGGKGQGQPKLQAAHVRASGLTKNRFILKYFIILFILYINRFYLYFKSNLPFYLYKYQRVL